MTSPSAVPGSSAQPTARPTTTASEDLGRDGLDRLRRLCELSSPSHDRDGLARTAQALVQELRELGLEAEIDEDLSVTASTAGRAGSRPIFAVGHYDTVLPARPARRDGDRFYASGAVDMKGGIAALLASLHALRRGGGELPSLRLALVGDEEIGGPQGPSVVERFAPSCAEMWILEPGRILSHDPGDLGDLGDLGDPGDTGEHVEARQESLVVGRWGLATWTLQARGVAAHSGLDFESGRSAVVAAAQWIVEAQGLCVEPDRSSFNAAAFTLPGHGPSEEPPLNVIPPRAQIAGELRFADEETGANLQDELSDLSRRVSRQTGVELRFQVDERVAAYAARDQAAWWPDLQHLAADVGLDLAREPSRRGISFSNFLPPDAEPLVIDGLGPVGDGMHTKNEWVCLRSLEQRTRLLLKLLRRGGVAGGP